MSRPYDGPARGCLHSVLLGVAGWLVLLGVIYLVVVLLAGGNAR